MKSINDLLGEDMVKALDDAMLDAMLWMGGSPPHDWTIAYERLRLKRLLGFDVTEKTWTMLKGIAFSASQSSPSSPEKWLRYHCDCMVRMIKGTEALSLELGRQMGKVVGDTVRQFIIDCPLLNKKAEPLRAKKELHLRGWYFNRRRIPCPQSHRVQLQQTPPQESPLERRLRPFL